jgi:hypothetical protein
VIDLAFWTGLSIGTLLVVPLVVFGWFLRDAAALMREMKAAQETTDS